MKNIDTIITGHSTTMTMADLARVRAVQQATSCSDVQAAKKAGKSVDEVARSLEDSGEVQGLRGASRGAPEGKRPDRLRRNEVGRHEALEIVFAS